MSPRSERAQATVLALIFLTVLLGLAAAVLDVGSWYRADRAAQSAADSAALAGAQALPDAPGPGTAASLALSYAGKNGGGLASGDVSFSGKVLSSDTISVRVKRTAPGVFTRILGIASVDVGAKASARALPMSAAKYVAPITVNKLHPKLAGTGCPCFQQLTTLPLGKTGAPGAFALVNLDQSKGGTGPGTLADWILKGLDAYLPLGSYLSDPGAKWNSSQVQDAMTKRIGTELLFPVYDTLTGTGANAAYHVIGWVGFHVTAIKASGSSGSVSGWFTQVIWTGIQATSKTGQPSFGARAVSLVD